MAESVHVLRPSQGLGLLTLGSSLWEVLHLIDENRTLYPLDEFIFSRNPVTHPSYIRLYENGIHLHFDGPQQILRLIEVVDLTKIKLTYDGHEVTRSQGPNYRHIVNLFGPTFPGEYLPPHTDETVMSGTFVLSYPGVAIKFPVDAEAWSTKKDVSSCLSSGATQAAQSLALFKGSSWPEVRGKLYSEPPESQQRAHDSSRNSHNHPDGSIDLARVHGEGRIELITQAGESIWITLSETTPQDLITEFGPPDAIYRKTDRRLSIHKTHMSRRSRRDTGASSHADPLTSQSDNNPDLGGDETYEHFYNYFRLGFDVLISQPAPPSITSPTNPEAKSFAASATDSTIAALPRHRLTATKLLIRGNVPGSWDFNRYRRLRWTIEHCPTAAETLPLSSEMEWSAVSTRLKQVWSGTYADETEAERMQRGMVLDRAAGNGLDSSVELLGNWEEEMESGKDGHSAKSPDDEGKGEEEEIISMSELFGFPGMVFDVLKNGSVGCLQVF